MRRRLIPAVLALYPPAVRDRYGDEIAELLTDSATPARDLADTAWCALRDRAAHRTETLTVPQARTAAFTLFKLLITPFAFGVLLLTMLALTGMAVDLSTLHEAGPYAFTLIIVLALLPAWWLGRWMARTEPIAASAVVVPVTLGLGLAGIAAVPYLGVAVGEVRAGTLAAAACWAGGAIALGLGVRALLRRGRRAAAWIAGGFGALLLMEAATAAYVLTALSPERAPRRFAPLWYPSSVTFWDPGVVDGAYRQLEDSIKGLPPVLTMCTVFVLAVAGVTARTPRPAPESA